MATVAGSVVLLGMAMKSLPVGTSCAVWVGAVGTAIPGVVPSGEAASVGRTASFGPTVAGVVGLKPATPALAAAARAPDRWRRSRSVSTIGDETAARADGAAAPVSSNEEAR